MNHNRTAGEEEIAVHLKTLMRGLSQRNLRETYNAYRALYMIGEPAVPQIRESLLKSNWTEIKNAGEAWYVSGLLNLLHDISEAEAERVAGQIISAGCDMGIRRVVESIGSFKQSDYVIYVAHGVTVYEHKGLADQAVRSKLIRWLKNIPEEDLAEIERLYVIPPDDRKSMGSYTPTLFNVTLVWLNPFSRRNPLSWLAFVGIQHTLFHEVGHHFHRHTWGEIPEQEEEANAYANRLLWRSRLGIGCLARGFKKCLACLAARRRGK
jgi:hypothetical protein